MTLRQKMLGRLVTAVGLQEMLPFKVDVSTPTPSFPTTKYAAAWHARSGGNSDGAGCKRWYTDYFQGHARAGATQKRAQTMFRTRGLSWPVAQPPYLPPLRMSVVCTLLATQFAASAAAPAATRVFLAQSITQYEKTSRGRRRCYRCGK